MTGKPLASRFLQLLTALFISLGLGYETLTPIFENSDETLHYPYVKHLADGQGLPLAIPGQLWNQEGTQHPLYYAIVAASTFWIDSDNLPAFLQRNPHWLFSDTRAVINDNQNLVLHGPPDAFPYRRAALAIHIGRWWSLAFGLLTVFCTFRLARYLFPDNLPLTLTATALTALNPQFIRVSSTVSNDSLSAALTTLTVLVALKITAPSSLTRQKSRLRSPTNFGFWILDFGFLPCSPAPLLLGLLCGLALLTKLSSLTILFVVAFILFGRLFFIGELHERPFLIFLKWLGIVILVVGLMSGWWFWRNYQLYGEWLAAETHLNLAGRGDLSLGEVWALRAEIERAYWATFGWGQIRPPEWVYQLLFWFTRIGLIGLALGLIARLIQGPKTGPFPLNLRAISFEKIILLGLWAGLNGALYLRWAMAVGSVSHSRLMFPAIAAISLLLALGWHALAPRRLAMWFSGSVMALLLLLNIYSLGWLIKPAFKPYERANKPVNAAELHLSFLDRLTLTDGRVYPQRLEPTTAKPERRAGQGGVIIIEAGWRAGEAIDKNYSVAAALLAPDGGVLAQRETYPGLGLRPTRYIRPDDVFWDIYPLKLTQAVAEPIVARATVHLFDIESETRAGFPAVDAGGNVVTPLVGAVKIVPDPWPVYHPEHSAAVNFDNAIALIGYDITGAPLPEETAATQAQTLQSAPSLSQLTLYWESLRPVGRDYIVFLHLLDAQGRVIGRADAPPAGDAYPTGWWAPGEIIADRRPLPAVPGAATIRLGLYALDSGQRLPIVESTLLHQDNGVEIRIGN